MQPLFSILIANYNNGVYLTRAIQSVMAQTYTNWEIIIVDDCSTDGLSETAYAQYANDERFHIYYNEENRGCGYTKRRCAELANGEIAGFLDPDDCLIENALEVMVETHLQHLQASLCYSTHYVCDDNLQIQYVSNVPRAVPNNTDYLHYQRGAVQHFATFKVDKYRQTEGINACFKRAEDQDLYYKLEEVGDLIHVPQPLYLYRIHAKGMSQNANLNKSIYWHVLAVQDACRRRGIECETEDIVGNIITISTEHLRKQLESVRCTADKYHHPNFRNVLSVIKKWLQRK